MRSVFGQTEDVHHAVIADAVAATKLPVRVVVESTPTNAPGNLRVAHLLVLDAGVAQCVFHEPFFMIEYLRWEHMAVELGNQVRDVWRINHVVGKVVVGEHIFQQAAFDVKAHAPRLARGV